MYSVRMGRYMINYNSYDHRSLEFGYQNVQTAKALARFVTKTMSKKYGRNAKVAIYGIDGSSIYLAAFCKALRPDWLFYSGSKSSDILNYYSPDSENDVVHIFVDDCLCGGNASRTIDNLLSRYSNKNINEFFYICGNRHRIDIPNASVNFLT